ncbi:putative RNA-directed DNA polymerase [Rosa chinensis]|uniref:Putative RNA-directed DNA polymerase n=1 Tax=Rosa chinensis TaxID=74649 RepID=A0A2P6S3D2_ROSCH|nr:putative RNA-directed DNA polymerase [Rosa chinensis]
MIVPPNSYNAIEGDVVTHFASNSATDAQAQPKSSLVASKAPRSFCKACSFGKLGPRPSYAKDPKILIPFLQRIQGDICGPIQPSCGPFKYFMVLVDASTRWSHVALLSTRNAAYAKLLAQIIRLRAHYPDHPIKSIRLDNAGEFTSKTFDDYCMSLGIDVEHPVPHVHTQNGLAEAAIKRLQMIARTLVMHTNLPVSAWGYAILHAATLIRLRPTATQSYSALQLVTGYEPNISHLRIFGCTIYVPITPPQRTKMGPQRRISIYVGYESPTIVRYLEPLTGDLFTARFADCHFDETVFPSLGGDKNTNVQQERQELSWSVPTMSHLDPHTAQSELEVRRIIELQNVADTLPDAFSDIAKVTRSHIPAANVPARIDVPNNGHNATPLTLGDGTIAQHGNNVASMAVGPARKRGRPIGSKDTRPRKRANEAQINPLIIDTQNPSHENVPDYGYVQETSLGDASVSEPIHENIEISVNYTSVHGTWERNSIIIDDVFAYSVAREIIETDDIEPRSVDECQRRADWPKWKDAIQAELDSLTKRKVFGKIVPIPPNTKPVGHKWVFVRKRNEKNEIVRYKARLVAQGFSQRPGIDYEETYSPVMDVITFRYLVSLVVSEKLNMQLMDVVTAYLYGDLDTEIYMNIPDGIQLPKSSGSNPRSAFAIRLKRSLYGLKQSGRMWYNRLSDYLIGKGYVNNELCPCVFIKRTSSGFSIVAVYVDDMNIIGTLKELRETAEHLKSEFEMKDLGKTRFCLGLELEHRRDGILIHQSAYTQKMLRRFNTDKIKPSSTPMVVRSLDPKKDPFRPKDDDEEVLEAEVPYLSAIGALLYLAQCTRPDISFAVNLLARYSSAPTRRHWTGVKDIFRYLSSTIDMGLFYPYRKKMDSDPSSVRNATHSGLRSLSPSQNDISVLEGFADAGYLSDPHKGRSQTDPSRYLFKSCRDYCSSRSSS